MNEAAAEAINRSFILIILFVPVFFSPHSIAHLFFLCHSSFHLYYINFFCFIRLDFLIITTIFFLALFCFSYLLFFTRYFTFHSVSLQLPYYFSSTSFPSCSSSSSFSLRYYIKMIMSGGGDGQS